MKACYFDLVGVGGGISDCLGLSVIYSMCTKFCNICTLCVLPVPCFVGFLQETLILIPIYCINGLIIL
jgi:hypothetical protein